MTLLKLKFIFNKCLNNCLFSYSSNYQFLGLGKQRYQINQYKGGQESLQDGTKQIQLDTCILLSQVPRLGKMNAYLFMSCKLHSTNLQLGTSPGSCIIILEFDLFRRIFKTIELLYLLHFFTTPSYTYNKWLFLICV